MIIGWDESLRRLRIQWNWSKWLARMGLISLQNLVKVCWAGWFPNAMFLLLWCHIWWVDKETLKSWKSNKILLRIILLDGLKSIDQKKGNGKQIKERTNQTKGAKFDGLIRRLCSPASQTPRCCLIIFINRRLDQPEKRKRKTNWRENKSKSNKRWFDLMGWQGRTLCNFPEKTEAERPNPAKTRPAIWFWTNISCFHHQTIVHHLRIIILSNNSFKQ